MKLDRKPSRNFIDRTWIPQDWKDYLSLGTLMESQGGGYFPRGMAKFLRDWKNSEAPVVDSRYYDPTAKANDFMERYMRSRPRVIERPIEW